MSASPVTFCEDGGSHTPPPEIKIVKQSERGIVPNRRLQLLRRIEIAQSEVGRLNKLLDEIRADVLHLTTE